ncbi:MAG: glycosyltransferase, partial [Candidatus Krumholzibacteriota bacterium]|nr:glycosyltransferase [Candidatus Krumholzibacteriota bacterium]
VDGRDTYKRLYSFESPNLVIIPPGVDTKRFRPLADGETNRKLDVPDDFVFALSRIDSNKGLDYLIRAFGRIKGETTSHLVIGGGSRNPKEHEVEVKKHLTDIVDELDLSDRVTFTSYVPDEFLDAYYRQTRLFVLPSKYEPFGMTTTEAMSCGTPVVVTKFGGIRRDLSDGKDALLVDVSDEEAFAATMTRVLQDGKLRGKLAAGALKTAREKFSWDGIARRHITFYERYL